MNANPLTRRRHKRLWTDAENALLRELWGNACERTLRTRLGRTTVAIYQHARDVLGLPPQTAVANRAPLWALARRLGIDHAQLLRFLASCAITPELRAPVGHQSAGFYRHRAAEPEQVEALFIQRETRTATRDGWAREEGTATHRVKTLLRRAGVASWNAGPRGHVRFPVGVFEEARAGVVGPWRAAWAAVLDEAEAAPLPCAAWLLALAAHDTVHVGDPIAREWVEWIPQGPLVVARRIARRAAGPGAARAQALAPGSIAA